MNFKTTILLLIVLAVIVAGSWYAGVFSTKQEQTAKEPPAVVKAENILLISPPLKDVEKIRLEVADRGFVQFAKDGQKWSIVEPIVAPALPWEVTDLTAAFESAHKLETVKPDSSLSLADMGLDKPAAQITFEEKGRKITLLVGKNVIASENTYVKTPDRDEVYVIDQNLKEKIKKDLSEYRDKQLWAINKNNVNEIVFTDKDGKKYQLAKDDKGNWTFASPIQAPADKKVLASAVDALASLKAEEFTENTPKDLAMFGLDKPVWRVTVVETETVKPAAPTTQASKPVTKKVEHQLLIGQPAGLNSNQVYVKLADKNWVVTLAQDNLKKVLPDLVAWRDKVVLFTDKNKITSVDIKRSAQNLTLFKENQNWKVRQDGEDVSADEKVVSTVLDTLTQLQAASFIDQPDKKLLKKSRLDDPLCTVTVYAGDKTNPIVLTVGDVTPSGMFRYVKRSGLDYISAVATDKLQPLFTPAISYRDKQMMAFDIDAVKTIQVKHRDRLYTLARSSASEPWLVTSPIQSKADQGKAKDLLMALMTLTAEDYVAKGYLANYNLEHPDVEVSFEIEMKVPVVSANNATTRPAAQKHETRLIKKQFVLAVSKMNDQYYAVRPTEKNPLVALVSPQLYTDVTAELIDRNAFGDTTPNKEAITHIELDSAGASPMVFEKINGTWTLPADPAVSIDQSKFESILNTFANLKVAKFVAFDDKKADSFDLNKPYFKITATAGKASWTLVVGKDVAGRENRYAAVNTRPWIFEMTKSHVKKMNISLKDLAKTSAAEVPSEQSEPAY
jgi:hypothetical protein